MNWNEAIQQLAETHWKPRKPVAGYRFFHCEDCGLEFKGKTRDCLSPSCETCPNCFADAHPHSWEDHPEWPLDKSGNLI